MIIKSLELENIRSYKKQLVEFEEGINFLSGDIGSGKSSILQAVEFAFFGFKRGDLEAFHLLRKGEVNGSVLLKIENEGDSIEILRRLKRAKNGNISQENGYIKFGENIVDLSPTELNSQVFEILNFPKEFISKDRNLLYRFTIYTPQEQLKEVLYAEVEKRLEVIRKIFGIDKYKQLKDGISFYLTKLKDEKKEFEIKSENILNLEKDLKEIEKENSHILKEVLVLEEKEKTFLEKKTKYKAMFDEKGELLEKIREKLVLFEKNLSKIEEVEKNLKLLEEEKREKESNLKVLVEEDFDKKLKEVNLNLKDEEEKLVLFLDNKKDELLKEENFLKLKEDFLKKDKLLDEVKNKEEVLKSKKKSFDLVLTKCKIKDLENKISSLEIRFKKLDKKKKIFEENNEKITKLKFEKESLVKDKEKLKRDFDNFSSIDNCPVCRQDVSKEHKHSIEDSLKKDLSEIDKKYLEVNLNLEKLESEQKLLKDEIFDLDDLNVEILKSRERLEILFEQKKKEEELNLEVLKLEKEIMSFDRKKIEKDMEDFSKIENEEKQLKEKLEKLREDELDMKDRISKLNLEKLSFENKSKELLIFRKEIDSILDKIKRLSQVLDKKGQLEDNFKKIKEKEVLVKEQREKLNGVLEKIYVQEKEFSSKISSLKMQVKEKEKVLDEKKKQYDDAKKFEGKLKVLIERENFFSRNAIDISQTIERFVFTKFYVEFNEEFERIFKDLIEDNEIDVRLDEDFSPVVEQNGYDIDIKNLSGGEKSSLALAYRLGLKKIIENNLSSEQRLSLLILDEPSDGFSQNQVDRMGEILKNSNLKQIILVSHDEKVESISDKIFLVEKVNHVSFVK